MKTPPLIHYNLFQRRRYISFVSGFTLVELLVVIIIIAILAGMTVPVIIKSTAKANINKAKAEMANLASIGSIIKLDTGGYVDLDDYDLVDSDIDMDGSPTTPQKCDESTTGWTKIDFSGYTTTEFQDIWDGPYITYQPDEVDGSGYPLDPWGTAYRLGWNNTEKVMIIYSAGPDKTWDTNQGDVTVSGDDILYKFK